MTVASLRNFFQCAGAPCLAAGLGLSGWGELGAAVPASEWKLPPLVGDFSGDFSLEMPPGSPGLHWRVVLETPRPRVRRVEFTLEGPGLLARGEAVLDPLGEGEWWLRESRLDLAPWGAWLVSWLGPTAAGLTLAGELTASAAGTWRHGVLGGQAVVRVRDGRIDHPAQKLWLEGLTLDLAIDDLAKRRAGPGQILAWRSGRYDVIALGKSRLEFSLENEEVRVHASAIDVLGGELTINSFVMSTQRREFSVIAQLRGLALEQMLFLVPAVLAEAKGQLDGELTLRRDAHGIQIGAGRLALRAGEAAELRLAPSTTSLSANLPASVQKFYPGLARMETGGLPLRAHLLEVVLTPDGDGDGRTATVHLAGGPTDPTLSAPIDLRINVRGPLESLMKFGSDSRLRFGEGR